MIARRLGVAESTVYRWLADDLPTTAARPAATPRIPALNKARAAELHRRVAAYDRGRGRFDLGVAGRALRDAVADLLGGWQPPAAQGPADDDAQCRGADHPGGTP